MVHETTDLPKDPGLPNTQTLTRTTLSSVSHLHLKEGKREELYHGLTYDRYKLVTLSDRVTYSFLVVSGVRYDLNPGEYILE